MSIFVNGFWIYDPMADKWKVLEDEASPLGLPIADGRRGGGPGDVYYEWQAFERGYIVHIHGNGVFAVWGDIAKRWRQLGLVDWGLPLTDELPRGDGVGRYNEFLTWWSPEKALILWSPDTGAWEVMRPLRGKWEETGGEAGALGYPTGPLLGGPNGGVAQDYARGAIASDVLVGTHMLLGPVAECWRALGRMDFGYPTSDAMPLIDLPDGRIVHFAHPAAPDQPHATIISTPQWGTHGLTGDIRKRWSQNGFFVDMPGMPQLRNRLGYPAGPANPASDGVGVSQRFAFGEIAFHAELGAVGVLDPVAARWRELGGEGFGYPVTEEVERPTLDSTYWIFRAMHVEGRPESCIITGETGTHPVVGAIFTVYRVLGLSAVFNLDPYGLPLGAESVAGDGAGRAQDFEHGTLVWHPEIATPYFIARRFRERWVELGREGWGYPITHTGQCPDEIGWFQHFRAMHLAERPELSIYQAPFGLLPQPVAGPIRARWASRGWERSNVGYPLLPELPLDDGSEGRYQQFLSGRIVWYPDTGALFDPLTFAGKMESGGLATFGGWINISVYADGRVHWHGHGNTSGADGYTYQAAALLQAPGDLPLAFSHKGHVYGTFQPGDRRETWSQWHTDLYSRDQLAGINDAARFEFESDYASDLAGLLKDTIGIVIKWVAGTIATMNGIGLVLVGMSAAMIGAAASGGNALAGLRTANGLLWMAGPQNTLLALGSELIVHAGENEKEIPQDIYDRLNEEVFAGSLPARDKMRLTDTQGAGGAGSAFVFPRFDGKLTINLGQYYDDPWNANVDGGRVPGEVLAHELVHCCQAERWGHRRFISSGVAIGLYGLGGNAYEYALGGEYRGYNLEQQAAIVSDWFAGRPGLNQLPVPGNERNPDSPAMPYVLAMRAGQF